MTINNNLKEVTIDMSSNIARALTIFTGVLFLSPESGYVISCEIDNRAQILKSKMRNRK